MLCATLINKVVDVPIINEATEQIIALKAVDVVADHMEAELEKAGLATFFDGVRDMSEKDVDKWVKGVTERVNKAVDLPMLDETQEGIVIEMVVRLIAHKFVGEQEEGEEGLVRTIEGRAASVPLKISRVLRFQRRPFTRSLSNAQ